MSRGPLMFASPQGIRDTAGWDGALSTPPVLLSNKSDPTARWQGMGSREDWRRGLARLAGGSFARAKV